MSIAINVDGAEHALMVLKKLRKMRQEKSLCDFVIKVQGEEVHAHRDLLCAGSPFFDKLLSDDTEENQSGVLELPNSDPKCVNICIDYLYAKTNSIPNDKYEELMRTAKWMKLDKLCKAIASVLEKHLSVQSFYTAMAVLKIHDCKTLGKKCTVFARLNFTEIVKNDEFVKLDKDFIKELIRLKNVKISEQDKLDAVLKWIKYDTERSGDVMEMMKFVDLKEISFVNRQQLIEKESVINSNEECLLHFSLSLLDSMDITLLSGEGKTSGKHESVIVIFDGITWHLQQFNPKDGSLVRKHEIIEEIKMCFSAVTFNGYIYVLTGNGTVYRLKYADDNAKWERMADMLHSHGLGPPAVVLSGRIYVVGGDIGGNTGAVEVYDPELDEWSDSTPRPVRSIASGTINTGGEIYCFGGYLDGEVSNKVAKFDPFSDTWTELPPMKNIKSNVSPIDLNDKIYVIGGHTAPQRDTRTVECYDIKTNTWTTVKRLKRPRFKPDVLLIEGVIFAFGGAKTSTMFEKYNAAENEWITANLPIDNVKIFGVVKIDLPC